MKIFISSILLLCSAIAFSQNEKKMGELANEAYDKGNFELADSLYQKSLEMSPNWNEVTFNQGDALYRQGDFEGAAEKFGAVAEKMPDATAKAEAYHNLGNAQLSMEEFDKAAAAYRKSLINNPSDEDSRYNLAYAQKMLQKQQEQEKQEGEDGEEGDEEGEDQEEGEKGDGDENGEKKEGEDDQEGDENQEGDEGEDQDKKDEQDKDGEPKDGDQKKEEQQAEPLKLSKEDAARMLESLKQSEREILAKLQRQKGKGKKVKIEKDW